MRGMQLAILIIYTVQGTEIVTTVLIFVDVVVVVVVVYYVPGTWAVYVSSLACSDGLVRLWGSEASIPCRHTLS